MKDKKAIYSIKLLIILVLSVSISLCGSSCKGKKDKFIYKNFIGIDAVFDESLGYYNESPSIIDISSTRYIYYTKNNTINKSDSESIYVRKGTMENGVWKYESSRVALAPSSNGWDSVRVFQADVVSGNFTFNREYYSYLMAYCGNSNSTSRKNAQIGLALSKAPTGPFVRVGTMPFITWNAYDYSQYGEVATDGVCEPSLINYDGNSKIIIFYSLFNPNSGASCKYITLDLNYDLLSLTSRKGERGNLLSSKGIADMGVNSSCIGADFAISVDGNTLFAVRDYYPVPMISPNVAEAVQVVKAPIEIIKSTISNDSYSWSIVNDKISSLDTAVWEEADKTGYDRIYSACIVSNEFSKIQDANNFSISFTSSALASSTSQYKYTPMIHELAV